MLTWGLGQIQYDKYGKFTGTVQETFYYTPSQEDYEEPIPTREYSPTELGNYLVAELFGKKEEPQLAAGPSGQDKAQVSSLLEEPKPEEEEKWLTREEPVTQSAIPSRNPIPAPSNSSDSSDTSMSKLGFKFPPLDAFDGKPDTKTGGSKAREFYVKCEIYFDAYSGAFDTYLKRSWFILYLCKEAAYTWALSYMGAISDSTHKLRPILKDGVKFKTAFLAQFSSIDPVQAATFKLNRLHHTRTISEFSARFRELASQTDWNDPSKISFYYSKLQDRIKDTIVQAASAPGSYEDYVNWAIQIGECLKTRQSEQPRGFQNQSSR
ncbi:hypothetical protein FRB95_004176, partial [Tulasnella sp. JGI-2019a]